MSKSARKNSKGLKSYKEFKFYLAENTQGTLMTSFELFILFKFSKNQHYVIFLYFFSPKIDSDVLHHFMN